MIDGGALMMMTAQTLVCQQADWPGLQIVNLVPAAPQGSCVTTALRVKLFVV
jgi:hypothetical protein